MDNIINIDETRQQTEQLPSTGLSKQCPVPSEFLTFRLGNEEYGIDIQKVQELRGYETVTTLARAPDYLKGVINLRGIIVPIIDMRIKFSLSTPTYDQFTVVIVLNLNSQVTAIVVDSVSDVIQLSADQIKVAPETGDQTQRDELIGLGTLDDRMLILLDIDKLMARSSVHPRDIKAA